MTPDERDRLTRVEQQHADMLGRIEELQGDVKQLLAAFNMGKGNAVAWAKMGGMMFAGAAALGWFYDHLLSPLIGKH